MSSAAVVSTEARRAASASARLGPGTPGAGLESSGLEGTLRGSRTVAFGLSEGVADDRQSPGSGRAGVRVEEEGRRERTTPSSTDGSRRRREDDEGRPRRAETTQHLNAPSLAASASSSRNRMEDLTTSFATYSTSSPPFERAPSPSSTPLSSPAGPSHPILTTQASFVHSHASSSGISTPVPSAPPPHSSHKSTPSTRHRPRSPSSSSRPTLVTSTSATLPVSHSSLSRRHDPVLPHAKVAPAPPTGMYWSKTPVGGRVPRGMRAHSSTMVDNDVWCFGGCDIQGKCSRELWKLDCGAFRAREGRIGLMCDAETFTWSKPKAVGDLPPPTRAHTAIVVDRRLFIIGGGDGPTYFNETYYLDTSASSLLFRTPSSSFSQSPSHGRSPPSSVLPPPGVAPTPPCCTATKLSSSAAATVRTRSTTCTH